MPEDVMRVPWTEFQAWLGPRRKYSLHVAETEHATSFSACVSFIAHCSTSFLLLKHIIAIVIAVSPAVFPQFIGLPTDTETRIRPAPIGRLCSLLRDDVAYKLFVMVGLWLY